MIDLVGKRVLITGGSRGIGASSCHLFARAGAHVAVHYHRKRQVAEDLAAEIESQGLAAPILVGADLRSPDEITRVVETVSGSWDRLDCLVNNAAVWVRNELTELDSDLLEETWRLNIRAPYLLAHAVLPLLRRGQDPNIVNITSTAGQRGEAFHSPYAASKGALISTTKSWAAELAPQIRVNSVAPGWVDTDMSASAFADNGRAAIEATIPLGRVASPEEIAGAVLFLASPLASDITGEILNVNGGGVLCG